MSDLILNISKSSSEPVFRPQVKKAGGWKEKHKLKKLLKHQHKKSTRQQTTTNQDTENNTKEDFPQTNKRPINQTFTEENTLEPQNESPIFVKKPKTQTNPNEQTNTLRPKSMSSSLFTSNEASNRVKIDQIINSAKEDKDSNPETLKISNDVLNSSQTFKDLGLTEFFSNHLKTKLNVSKPTQIQKLALSNIFRNSDGYVDRDSFIRAETGSGKTLAYLLPILNRIFLSVKEVMSNDNKDDMPSRNLGTLAIVLTPTRELAKQVFDTLSTLVNISRTSYEESKEPLVKSHWIVPGLAIGGDKRQSEKARLRKGVTILACTPGRLLDHLKTTASFNTINLRWLVLDEADLLLEMGFQETLTEILDILDSKSHENNLDIQKSKFIESKHIPKTRINILCSATLKDNVKKLADRSLNNPVLISNESLNPKPNLAETFKKPKSLKNDSVEQEENFAIPSQLLQEFIVAPPKLRLVALTSLLKLYIIQNPNAKIIVFLSCRDSVKQTKNLNPQKEKDQSFSISPTLNDSEIYRLHGSLSQPIRSSTISRFNATDDTQNRAKVLFCTDVAARGLDLPEVSHIIQYDAPSDTSSYIHRVGRTARLGKLGRANLILMPSEIEYLNLLAEKDIKVKSIDLMNLPGMNKQLGYSISVIGNGKPGKSVTGSVELEQLFKILAVCINKKPGKWMDVATDIQLSLEKHVVSNEYILEMAKAAFGSSVRAYATHSPSEKHIFHIKNLHLGHYAKSFALREPPKSINVGNKNVSTTKLVNLQLEIFNL
ncbi:hypothetical protein BB559_001326 [Furculomyces boomerangus]|uniref:ATP-dependent RNA helicase n=1 Tax=Furculomyces boomerangus TaxID=61424 RepID=A0A2T9Z2A5_9FUNG|nr:hypothetical protein BB559_001326 [Furculomyces boomerangus]